VVDGADRATVSTFYAPGAWGASVELDEAAAHHAQVKRLQAGDLVRLSSGDGRRVVGTLAALAKRRATVTLHSTVEDVALPPVIELLAPVGDRERMLLLAEKAVELGASGWRPVVYRRSRSVTPRGEGDAFREKVRLRMIAALEQSGSAWLPALHPESSPEVARASTTDMQRVLLDAAGLPLADLGGSLTSPCALALGPEGGLDPDERDGFTEVHWRLASLGPNVLRFETAGIAGLAMLGAFLRQGR
jgi:16S rRNA (uracil1498-N3)-methyltransferase